MQPSKSKSKHDGCINTSIEILENKKKSSPILALSSNVSHGDYGKTPIHSVNCQEILPASKMTLKHLRSLLSKTKVNLFNNKKRCADKRNNSLEISNQTVDIEAMKLCQARSNKTLKYGRRLATEIPKLCYFKPLVSDVVKYHGYELCRIENFKSFKSLYSFSERTQYKCDSETFIKNLSSKDDSINDNQKGPVFNNQNVLNDLSENTAKHLENECESKSLIQIQNVIKERKIIGNCVVQSNVTTINIKEYQHYGYDIQSTEKFNYGDESGLIYKDRIVDSTKNVLIYVLDSENQRLVNPTLKCLDEEVKHSNQRILDHHVQCASKDEIDKLNKPNQCIAVSFLKEVDCTSEKISHQSVDKNGVSKSTVKKTNQISSFKDTVLKSIAATNNVSSINNTEYLDNSKQLQDHLSDKTSKIDYSPTSRISDLQSDQKYQLITSLINMINDKESEIKLHEQMKDYLEESNIRMSKPIADLVSLIRENVSLKNDLKVLSDQRISKPIDDSPLLLNIEVKEGVSSINVFKSPRSSVNNQILEPKSFTLPVTTDETRIIESVEKVKNLEKEKSTNKIDSRPSNNFSLLVKRIENGPKIDTIPNISISNDFGISNGTQTILEINVPVNVEDIQVDKESIAKSSHETVKNLDQVETKPSLLQINELDFELIPSVSQVLNSTNSTQTSVESTDKISETDKARPDLDVVIVDVGRGGSQNGTIISKSMFLSVVNGSGNKISEPKSPSNIGQAVGIAQTNPLLLPGNLITDFISDDKLIKSNNIISSPEKETKLDNILTMKEEKASSSKISSVSNKIHMPSTDLPTTEVNKISASKITSLSNKGSFKNPLVKLLTADANKVSTNKESSLSNKMSLNIKSLDKLSAIEGIALPSNKEPSLSSKIPLKENTVDNLVITQENKLPSNKASGISNKISLKENTVGDIVPIVENKLPSNKASGLSNKISLKEEIASAVVVIQENKLPSNKAPSLSSKISLNENTVDNLVISQENKLPSSKNTVGDLVAIEGNKPPINIESSLFKTVSLKDNNTSDLLMVEENKSLINKEPDLANKISSKENTLTDISASKENKLPSTKEQSLSSKMSFNVKNSSYQPTIEIRALPSIKESSISNKISLNENTHKDLLTKEENRLPSLKESGLSIKISFKESSSDERVIKEDDVLQINKEPSITNKISQKENTIVGLSTIEENKESNFTNRISSKENTPGDLLLKEENKQHILKDPSISINISFKETSSEERLIVEDNLPPITKEPSLTNTIPLKEDSQENILAANNELTGLIEPILSNTTSILSGNKSDSERISPSNLLQNVTSSQTTIEIIQSPRVNSIPTTETENINKQIDERSSVNKNSMPIKTSALNFQIIETQLVQNASQTEDENKTNVSVLPINMTEKTISIQTNVPSQFPPQKIDNILVEEANKYKSTNTDSRDLPSIMRTMAKTETITINPGDLSTLNFDNTSVKKADSYKSNETDNQTLPYIMRTLATTDTITINPVKINSPLTSATQKPDNGSVKDTNSYSSNDTNNKEFPNIIRAQGRTETLTMNPRDIVVSVTLHDNIDHNTLLVDTGKKSIKPIDDNTKINDETQEDKQSKLASLKPMEKSNSKTSLQSDNGFLKGLKNSLIKRLSSSNKSEKKESIGKESNKSQKEKSYTKKSDSKKSNPKSLEPSNLNNTSKHKQKDSNADKTTTSIFESQTEYTPIMHLPDTIPDKSTSLKSLKILNNQNSLLTRSVLIHEDYMSDDIIEAVPLKTTSVFENVSILDDFGISNVKVEKLFSIFPDRDSEKIGISKSIIFLSATNIFVRKVSKYELRGDIVNENTSLISCITIGENVVLSHDNIITQINRISYFNKKASLAQNYILKSGIETQLSVSSYLDNNEVSKNVKYRSGSGRFEKDRNLIIENEDDVRKMIQGDTLLRMNVTPIENEIIFETNPLILEKQTNDSIRNITIIHKLTIRSDIISFRVLKDSVENCQIVVNKSLINSLLLAEENIISKTFDQQVIELSNTVEIQKMKEI